MQRLNGNWADKPLVTEKSAAVREATLKDE